MTQKIQNNKARDTSPYSTLQVIVLWVVMLCWYMVGNQYHYFGGPSCLHFYSHHPGFNDHANFVPPIIYTLEVYFLLQD